VSVPFDQRLAWRLPDEQAEVAEHIGLTAGEFAEQVLPRVRTCRLAGGVELLLRGELEAALAGDDSRQQRDAYSPEELASRLGVSRDFVDGVLVPAGLPRYQPGGKGSAVLHPRRASLDWLDRKAARQLQVPEARLTRLPFNERRPR
jgi:hypothetical protein